MFQGTVPKPVIQKMRDDIKKNQDIDGIYIACSGNFSVERSLFELGLPIHSNDVSLYTTMLGDYFSGQDRVVSLSEDGKTNFSFLEEYIKAPLDKAATALCLSNVMQYLYPRNLFEERNLKAYLDTWHERHESTKAKLEESEFVIDSYNCEDFIKFLREMPEERCVIGAFPPTYKAGYEKMFKTFSSLFEWETPEYEIFDPDTVESVLGKAKGNTMYLITDKPIPKGVEVVRYVQASNKTVYLYVNDKELGNRLVTDELAVRPLRYKLFMHGQVSDDSVLSIEKIDVGEFNMLRTMYLNKSITMKNPSLCFGVFLDGYLIGAFGVNSPPSYMESAYFDVYPYCYLLSDFPIVCEVRKLAKLIVIAAMSKESQYAIQASFGQRVRCVVTTAFTEKAVSMKYRGLLKKYGEITGKDKEGINYSGKMGEWTLAEGLEQWRDRKKRMA